MPRCRVSTAGWLLGLMSLLANEGCTSAPSVLATAPYDSHAAHAALTAALDAWKSGDAKSLSKRSPPIRFVDDEFQRGLKLSHYELSDTAIRPFKDVPVILHLRDAKGGVVIPRSAMYQVSLEPQLSVLRSDT